MNNEQVMVSICCITYNHENFIAEAIQSFLMQEANFNYEIIIGDDCSTDKTQAVIKLYSDTYPGRIKLIASPTNLGTHKNLINCITQCSGKYIALCEGDDYWIDEHKLQKQVTFLENNPDFIICCHYHKLINSTNKTLYVHPNPTPLVHTYVDLLAGKQEETKTATVLYRNISETHRLFFTPWFFDCFAGDKMFKLSATQHTGGKIYVIPEVMSCYRNHEGGIWSMINAKVRMERVISDFNLIIKNFTYPAIGKKKLLLLYIKRYLVFELQNKRFRKAYNTLKYLL
ncbi:Glycosyltransferase involved in cell wall bisynthesis [Mucilaginibacter pineti]|uniref:Glycosyltransferase involved in cell wall bisynthesis n=1 Tax=Mucilaginibacter pineti TaxID=1391627 RepID=A0A1G6XEA5_9SPHI|nr:glycosyltransferase family 2 protein [Mucilaginibacter pineti]SDD76490.1 Glycosyltransferase involved in cell wall bisynthesis [Mucilaginibacter pineti]